MVRSFLWQVGVDDFSAGLSLSFKHCRVRPNGVGHAPASETTPHGEPCDFRISPAQTRSLDDLWAMPTIGKIIVFIILGLILLILSFLYQKLKDVLFKNDEEETN